MARVFITGSADGLGRMAGALLADQGHQVVLHARNDARAADAKKAAPKAKALVVGDLATIAASKDIARQAMHSGRSMRSFTTPRSATGKAITSPATACRMSSPSTPLRPYILTALIERPKRLVYLSSGMHDRADANLDDILWRKRRWDGSAAYAESKLYDVMLALTVARLWPNVLSNALTPGWGCRPRWAGRARLTTSIRRISPKRGLRPATNQPRERPQATSITSSRASRTPRRAMSPCKTGSSTSAGRSPGSKCRGHNGHDERPCRWASAHV
jgi:NAD(P)-dependent dehydrogenase (short-subunit alcohol dehydrogenase family)